jgi:hypothetical protein
MTAERPLAHSSLATRARRRLDHVLGTTGGKIVILALLVAYAWLASGVRTFTWPASLLTGVPGLLLVLLGLLTSGDRKPPRRPAGHDANRAMVLGRVAWSLVICSALAWELYAYAHRPREAYPTVSSMLDDLDNNHVGRSLVLMLWVVAGWDLLHR